MPSFLEKIHAAERHAAAVEAAEASAAAEKRRLEDEKIDPWIPVLRELKGEPDPHDHTLKFTTNFLLEYLNVEPWQHLGAAKRLKRCMLELGFTPIRTWGVNKRGQTNQVRAYCKAFYTPSKDARRLAAAAAEQQAEQQTEGVCPNA